MTSHRSHSTRFFWRSPLFSFNFAMITSCLVPFIVGPRKIGVLNLFTTANQCYVKLRACVSHLGSVLGIKPKKQQLNRLKKSLALYRHCSPRAIQHWVALKLRIHEIMHSHHGFTVLAKGLFLVYQVKNFWLFERWIENNFNWKKTIVLEPGIKA